MVISDGLDEYICLSLLIILVLPALQNDHTRQYLDCKARAQNSDEAQQRKSIELEHRKG